MSKKHHGTSLDSFLKEEGTFEETQALAIKEVVVWQLIEAMEKGGHEQDAPGYSAQDKPVAG